VATDFTLDWNPCTTCTYRRQLDHATKDCPRLIAKWKEKRNTNVQMVIAEKHNEQPNITVVMRGGTRTGVDLMDQGNRIHQWVRKTTEPLPLFDPRKEKETYTQARKEVIGAYWITSTSTAPPLYGRPPVYDMPLAYGHSKTQVDKVSILNSFLKSYLELMNVENALSMMCRIIDHCAQEKEIHVAHRAVNQVHNKKRTNREF
jgi:hypothetical protein